MRSDDMVATKTRPFLGSSRRPSGAPHCPSRVRVKNAEIEGSFLVVASRGGEAVACGEKSCVANGKRQSSATHLHGSTTVTVRSRLRLFVGQDLL